ncbi:MAG: heavy metal translocating P-type ATPase [Hyphomicrobiales bacterium]
MSIAVADHTSTPASPARRQSAHATFAIENMRCGGCLRSVEKALAAASGVSAARGNLSAKRVTVTYDPEVSSQDALIATLERAGFKAAPMALIASSTGEDNAWLRRIGVAGFAAANIMLLSVAVWSGTASDMDPMTQALLHHLSALIALPAVAYAGQPFFASGLTAVRAGRLNMDVPISLAVILATAMSVFQMFKGSEQVYFDASVTLLFFLLIGRWLDQRLRARAQGEAQNLLSLQSGMATVVDSQGRQSSIPAHALMPGMLVQVAAGERIPADGEISTGGSQVDMSLITGESAPEKAGPGAAVYAGTLNLTAPFTFLVTASDDMTLLSEIGRLMANAEQGRASYRRVADRAAALYAPVVHLLAAATFAGWLLLGAGWEQALVCAIAVLIITCPCALALAVPVVQIAAASRLFRRGVLIKSGDALERLAAIDTVVFDKTGTLTLGRPVLANAGNICTNILRAAGGLAGASRHPYARAVAEAARARLGAVTSGEGVSEAAGFGMVSRAASGEERLGSPSYCGLDGDGVDASVCYRSPQGKITCFEFEDPIRPDAANVVARLAARDIDVRLLSGDRSHAVQRVARELSVSKWEGEVTPARKIGHLDELRRRGHKVLMIGDGLNDAPALAAAHVSMSPASAADISQRAADLVFQGDRLSPLIEALDVARRSRTMAMQNFAIALAYNAICVPLAMAGYVTPLIAALAMSTSSILVTVNAMRLSLSARESGG